MEKTYDDVRAAFDHGTVVTASKAELEQLLLAVGRARVLDPSNQARAAEMGETMRQLLAARQSEESHSQAMGVAKVALWVAVVALLASLFQLVVSLNIVGPLKAPVWRLESSGGQSYRCWAADFAEGTYFEGSWERGAKIRFLSPPAGDGMLSEIAENREHAFISIRHLGMLANGVEDTTSDAVRAWAPAYENYTFTPVPEGTRLVVDLEVPGEWVEFMGQSWPRALRSLKRLSESRLRPGTG